MNYEIVRDATNLDEWRVEAIDHDGDGECFVAIFTGPRARERASEYAAWKNKSAMPSRQKATADDSPQSSFEKAAGSLE